MMPLERNLGRVLIDTLMAWYRLLERAEAAHHKRPRQDWIALYFTFILFFLFKIQKSSMERPAPGMARKQTATLQGTGKLSLQAHAERLIGQVAEMLAQIERIKRELNAITTMVMHVVMQKREGKNCPTLTLSKTVEKVTFASQIEKTEEIICSLNTELELPQKTTSKDVDKPLLHWSPPLIHKKLPWSPH
ncbi:uncharacterized protein G2W53_037116 [Senna tora]|uniref:Uncharacterized protein n=1 Tax=Senna tora TaxID=362788 RepID=A0A834SVP7_9FABA|nr:uncharacterized protein G2W53_037116 [Senna tora]